MNKKIIIVLLLLHLQFSSSSFWEKLFRLKKNTPKPEPQSGLKPVNMVVADEERKSNSMLTPVILVPGQGGSRIEAKLDKPRVVNRRCKRTTKDWIPLWVDVKEMFPLNIPCWADNIRLVHDEVSGEFKNSPGVQTRIPGFGDTKTLEYVDDSWIAKKLRNVGSYMAPLVSMLVSNMSYVRGQSLRGAPYDFRYAPHSQEDYFRKLKDLVEETYEMNDQKKVVFVAHSMGGLFANYFLMHQDQDWKNKYVRTLLTVNTPWGGSALIFNVYSSGFDYKQDLIDPLEIREEQRSYETGLYLIPNSLAWNKSEAIVITPKKVYTVENIEEFLDDIGYGFGKGLYKKFQEQNYALGHPGVPVHCLYTSGHPTPEIMIFQKGKFPDQQPERINGEGDGTVNLQSLTSCSKWLRLNEGTDRLHHIPACGHGEVLHDRRFLNYLKDMLLEGQ